MLGQRIATAAVLLLLIGAALYLGHAAFAALAALFIAMAIFEWLRLAGHRSKPATLSVAFLIGLLLGIGEWRGVPYPLQLSLAALALAIWLGVLGLLRRVQQGQPTPLSKSLSSALCLLLMSAAWFALMDLSRLGAVLLVSALAVVWVADIAAYFSGRAWGKRKLAALISPGKTWAGVGGAFAGVIGIALIAAQLWPALPLFTTLMIQRFSWPLTVLLLMGLVVLAIAGDLFESLLKRQAGVKDSGATLPGHGGVLDRIDALLPVLPAVLLIRHLGGF